MEKFIGIKQIWYGEVINEVLTAGKLKTWLGTATEVKNSHDGTWGYSQDDPSVSDYINELTGKPYYRDKTTDGNKTITWTSGAFEFTDKAALQGGTGDATHWESGDVDFVNKAVCAKTKTGNYIVFTNADIIAKADQQERAIGLGITAVAMDNDTDGVADEYWFKGSAVDGNSNSNP